MTLMTFISFVFSSYSLFISQIKFILVSPTHVSGAEMSSTNSQSSPHTSQYSPLNRYHSLQSLNLFPPSSPFPSRASSSSPSSQASHSPCMLPSAQRSHAEFWHRRSRQVGILKRKVPSRHICRRGGSEGVPSYKSTFSK